MRRPGRFFNRELSWLEFNQRVLEEAADRAVPLLERLNFLCITASNLDEFFMVRVGGLRTLRRENVRGLDPAGYTADEQLDLVTRRARRMMTEQYRVYGRLIEPALARAGIRRVRPRDLTDAQRRGVEDVFEREVSPVLSPAAVGSLSRMSLVRNLSLNMALRLKPRKSRGRERFAILPVGRSVPRCFPLPSARGFAFILVEDVLRLCAERFFPSEALTEAVPFRVTRNADLSVQEDDAADFLREMEEVLRARRQSDCVRVEVEAPASPQMLGLLRSALRLPDDVVCELPGPIELSSLAGLCALEGFDRLRNRPWPPRQPPEVDPRRSIFATLARGPLLLCHPYESFDPVVRLVEEAAVDPDVVAIKQILYRTSTRSPVVAALAEAARRGKYVTAIVELKARFDEARNIEWARQLEQEGAQVIYGVRNLKTHAKVCIVVRREPRGLVRYVHFGTGNYNERTARLYSDVSYMTCDPELGADASSFVNAVTGASEPQQLQHLSMAPLTLRERLIDLIHAETERRKEGFDALIAAKMNSLADTAVIDALYRASAAGVTVRLNVRGVCCLRPGVRGLSDNITVASIVDRFLEHSRIFRFLHGGDDKVFLSSADWMPRNLSRRIELMVPVEEPAAKAKLIRILDTYFADTVKARVLQPGGAYRRVRAPGDATPVRAQDALYRMACEASDASAPPPRTIFAQHRPAEKSNG